MFDSLSDEQSSQVEPINEEDISHSREGEILDE